MPEQDTGRLSWALIRRLALQHKRKIVLANLLAVLATLASVPIPLLLPLLVDEILLGQPGKAMPFLGQILPAAWQMPLGFIGCLLLVSLLLRSSSLMFNVLQGRLFTGLAKGIVYQLRLLLLGRLERIAMAEYESLGSGSVAAHLITDLDTLDAFIGETLSRFLVALLTLCGTAAILLWMHWQLALFILLLNPLVVLATVKLGKRVKHLKKQENDSTARFTQALTETLDAIHEVRAGSHQGYFFGRLRQRAAEARDFAIASKWKTEASMRASGLMFQFGIDLFRAAAMLTVLFSGLSIGQMLAVFSYLWFMIGPVEQLLNLQYALYGANGAMQRLNQLLARKDEQDWPEQENPFASGGGVELQVRNLEFAYRDEPVLRGLSFTVAAGEKVALVGVSGGGKSTLVQLLLGLYRPAGGQILFNGVELERIGLKRVRENLAVVLQSPALFNASIRENILLGRSDDDSACWRALEVAQLADYVRQLPEGLDTRVGRAGVRLSGGQRQRLAIARMVLADPAVVILDEATSALDSRTEQAVHDALQAFLHNRTTLIIAHRLSAVRQADRVLVLADGELVEQGDHHSLLAEKGIYAGLYGG
ncbi:MAG: ABC transporter ATP-binding protein [Gammaproteobacteria bacterium]|nr:ABC transporter ATP-binding protein [Gammaproteobacteria bacterium]